MSIPRGISPLCQLAKYMLRLSPAQLKRTLFYICHCLSDCFQKTTFEVCSENGRRVKIASFYFSFFLKKFKGCRLKVAALPSAVSPGRQADGLSLAPCPSQDTRLVWSIETSVGPRQCPLECDTCACERSIALLPHSARGEPDPLHFAHAPISALPRATTTRQP